MLVGIMKILYLIFFGLLQFTNMNWPDKQTHSIPLHQAQFQSQSIVHRILHQLQSKDILYDNIIMKRSFLKYWGGGGGGGGELATIYYGPNLLT
jgi:hypothetical protein